MNQGRKITGGKYHSRRKKRLHEDIGWVTSITLGETKRKERRVHGGFIRKVIATSNEVNISTGKGTKKATITNVAETPQNKFLARQNRLMKGVIVETTLGKAKITNRPSREGVINAILVEQAKK